MWRYFQGFRNSRFSLSLPILLLLLGLVRGLFYSIVIPPWQAPDEPGHLEYARLLSEKWRPLTKEDISPLLRGEMLASLREFHFWEYIHQPEPEQMNGSVSEDLFSVYWGTQVGDEPLLYYLVPAFIFSVTGVEDIILQLYIIRWFSVLLSSLVVVVAYLTAHELFPDDRFLTTAVPVFVVFLPMFTFIGASANNDSLAILVASLLIWRLARVLRRGLSWRSGLVVGALMLLSALAKKTALFTVPLVIIIGLIHLWRHHVAIQDGHRVVRGASCMFVILFLGLVLAWKGGDAAGWVELPESWMDTRSDSVARSGDYSLHVVDDQARLQRRLAQYLPFNSVCELRGNTVSLKAWVRSPQGEQRGCLIIGDTERRSLYGFSVSESWSCQGLIHTVSPQATSIRVVLRPGDCEGEGKGDLYFDDVVLVDSRGEGYNLLYNGSGEVSTLRISAHLERLGRFVSSSRFFDARSYDLSSLKRYTLYVLLIFPGFWANFGWLTIPLDILWYEILALISLVALIGLGLGTMRAVIAWRREEFKPALWQYKGMVLLFVAICLILIQVLLPMIGRDWQPQGRYLFPGVVPIATFFSLGWREVVRKRCHEFLILPWTAVFVLLDALCIFGYLIPYFNG